MMRLKKKIVMQKEILNEENKEFIETYGKTIDFTNKSNIMEIIEYCK
jgi:hypothetical protein